MGPLIIININNKVAHKLYSDVHGPPAYKLDMIVLST